MEKNLSNIEEKQKKTHTWKLWFHFDLMRIMATPQKNENLYRSQSSSDCFCYTIELYQNVASVFATSFVQNINQETWPDVEYDGTGCVQSFFFALYKRHNLSHVYVFSTWPIKMFVFSTWLQNLSLHFTCSTITAARSHSSCGSST